MRKAFFFLSIIFLTNIISLYYGWYLRFSWFDQVLHFSGGFFVAMLLTAYLKAHLFDNTKLKNILIILGAVSFIGVTWEFAEYIANVVLGPIIYSTFAIKAYFMGDLNDTINDLLMDVLGAGVFAFILHFIWSRKSQLHPFGGSDAHKVETNF